VIDVVSRASFRQSTTARSVCSRSPPAMRSCSGAAHPARARARDLFILSVAPCSPLAGSLYSQTRFPRPYSTCSRMLDDAKGMTKTPQPLPGASRVLHTLICARGRPVDGGTRLPRRPSRPRRDAAELSAARTVSGRRAHVRSRTHVQFLSLAPRCEDRARHTIPAPSRARPPLRFMTSWPLPAPFLPLSAPADVRLQQTHPRS
jgi:hypothetical protein